MASKTELSALRDEVVRLRKAVTRKVSRIKVTHGAQVSGSEFDPRRSPALHKRYTASQLRAYGQELSSFLSRGNQFVGGSAGVPIPRKQWQRYKAAESQYNARMHENFARVADIALPGKEPIWSRMARSTPRHRQLHNPAVNTPYDPPERKPGSVTGMRALDRLIADMEERLSGEYDKRKLDEGRDQFRKMADEIGDEELRYKADNLTNEQWELLWYYTDFANDVSFNYQISQLMYDGKDQAWHHKVYDDLSNEYHKLLDWAKQAR